MVKAFFYHLQLSLKLNFKSKQPLIYGYLVPIFFLIAFGAVFRNGNPPLIHQMSQLITISALGGACFGMPTALVSERERGWWRRYRLFPRGLLPLLASTLVARFILIASAAGLQVVLAHIFYGTPFPIHPIHFVVAYCAVAFAFLTMGLVIAAVAKDVPAVQALGQCIFMPLIMIGGVGVPLLVLPTWAQKVATFLPGKYACEALQSGFTSDGHGAVFRLNILVLFVMGVCAAIVGTKLFRWGQSDRRTINTRLWVIVTLLPWITVGIFALKTDRWHPLAETPVDEAMAITEAQMSQISYDNLPPDDGTVTPVAAPNADLPQEASARLDLIRSKLDEWTPGHTKNAAQAIRYLLCVAAVADVNEDQIEGNIAQVVFEHIQDSFTPAEVEHGLAWVALYPASGVVVTSVPELKIQGDFYEQTIRVRTQIYAVKFIGRVRHRLAN
jgi:ABC-2 type transport system permease protein